MVFVIGGSCQGKRAFAESCLVPGAEAVRSVSCPKAFSWTDGALADWNQFMEGSLCVNFHLFIRRLMNGEAAIGAMENGEKWKDDGWSRRRGWEAGDGELAEKLVSALMKGNPERILVTDEIGCGIVPLDAFERQYREETGRICCQAARKAAQVWRVCCGMGQRIK